MEEPYQKLLDENIEVRKALTATKELLERFRGDNDRLKTMHEDFKTHYDRLKQENLELTKANSEINSRYREATMLYDSQISRLKTGLEQKKKELEEAMGRIVAPLDTDLLRLKLIGEIEAPHRLVVERLQNEVNMHEARAMNLANQLSLLQQESVSYRVQSEKEYHDLEQRYILERNNFAQELQTLHGQIEELNDPEALRQARKERDELRRRVLQQATEIEELVKVREKLKSEKSAVQMAIGRELEEERDLRHAAGTERDSVKVQLKDAMDQLMQAKLQYDLKSQAVTSLSKERDELKVTSKVFEDQLLEYRSEVTRLRDELQRKTTEWELKFKRLSESDEAKFDRERQEKDRLLKEIEQMEKKMLETGKVTSDRGSRAEIDRLQQLLKNEQEEKALLKASASKLQQENESAKETTAQLKNREEQVRSLLQQTRESDTINMELQSKLRTFEDKLVTTEKELSVLRARANSEETQKRMSELKGKVREYKGKVHQCNQKIQELLRKLAVNEVERQRLEGDLKSKSGVSAHLSSVIGPTLAGESARQGHRIAEFSSQLRPS